MKTEKRLKICNFGRICLTVFIVTATVIFAAFVYLIISTPHEEWGRFLLWAVLLGAAEFLLFWTGIICVYLTSVQLGIRIRVLGAILGMVPAANIVMLVIIIATTSREVRFEREKLARNEARKEKRVCATRYPLLLVHGVFFRDVKALNYWGRIPAELEKNGALIYYGNQQSAASVPESGRELAERIKEIVAQTGCGKVNVIAHSKGGLDIRWALSELDIGDMVASVTTVNTPHRGCEFAQYLLEHVPEGVKDSLAAGYNGAMKKLGDEKPDFLAAVWDLTYDRCTRFDRELRLPAGIFSQSIGSKLNRALGGKFPLNFTYNLVKYFDGPNDGLVSEKSFSWGEKYTFLTTRGKRGISHGDVIDLNRENIPGFDVREFYVQLAADLKNRGL